MIVDYGLPNYKSILKFPIINNNLVLSDIDIYLYNHFLISS